MTSVYWYVASTAFLYFLPYLHHVDRSADWNLLLTPDLKDANLKRCEGHRNMQKYSDPSVDLGSVFDTSHRSPGEYVPSTDHCECYQSCGWLHRS